MFTALFKIRFLISPVQVFVAIQNIGEVPIQCCTTPLPSQSFFRIVLYIGLLYTFSLIYNTYTVELVFLKGHPVETEFYSGRDQATQ